MLEVTDLTICNQNRPLVDHISFTIESGEWYGLVGESGSGKSITSLSIGGLLPSSLHMKAGSIRFQGRDMVNMNRREKSCMLGHGLSYVFQDYQGAFTPFMKIGKQFDEVLRAHTSLKGTERRISALEALKRVKLPEEKVYGSYPFQLSGGQLQRASIAIAMMLKPSLLVADEITTALDSITAAHILKLLDDMVKETNCSVLFITHDLRKVKKYADRIGVMEKGKIVESGFAQDVLSAPSHPYTHKLLQSLPELPESRRRLWTGEREGMC
ncbi:ABC transporter ATP-binding protein [Bacillus sp. KH172YL63]|uniref:ABC transporter ATP-binding protein n=1 Tax=Bacillus sp. KH172YL63 TaxID=2709784 RepID=UPI0013E43A54|nr:ABC transporter ATP-binding protein [Bacillus sp. KH172YL63]BCB05273.1 hypothetical protein KH172YL63_34060 [Bacillus sp. KH172YL63]